MENGKWDKLEELLHADIGTKTYCNEKLEQQFFSYADETCRILEDLLHLTQRMDMDTSRMVYYSQTELEIIGHWAEILREDGKYKEGIRLCETVIQQMQHSKVGFEQQLNLDKYISAINSCNSNFMAAAYNDYLDVKAAYSLLT